MTDPDRSGPQDATAVRFGSPSSSDVSSGSRSRFTPGTLIADRFRIIAPLGRGGMGEVYRAEDVKLGQQVALKFLSRDLEHDRDRLHRLYGEVRLGRQVSHPNVCRLYDIVEYEGSHFISMEYIDGEDLGSLLRRIGKLPEQKALELTHEICAGLAAAHGVGIVHRDLKPANIMIDGRGRARVTDFGLAAAEEDIAHSGEMAGTPAYMAPEQLRGGQVTAKTDLYALGLILYEMFTGKRYSEAKASNASSATRDRSATRSTLSDLTKNLDPAIQRVIVRCLEEEPDARPPSIHAVIAALPGGDPLQAAIDAGETPSPEMVAAAGATGELPAKYGIPLFVLAIVLVLVALGLHQRSRLSSIVETVLEPAVLEQRGRDLAKALGYPPPRQTTRLFGANTEFARNPATLGSQSAIERAATLQPSPLRFHYRENPREVLPLNDMRLPGRPEDPPFNVPSMIRMHLDSAGRVVTFAAIPPQRIDEGERAGEPDFTPLLEASGIDLATLKETTPRWSAPVDTDFKRSWTGTFPGQPDLTMQIEGASRFGKPVFFYVAAPWATPAAPQGRDLPPLLKWSGYLGAGLMAVVLAGGGVIARRNWLRGRADRVGATKVVAAVLIAGAVARLLRSAHSSNPATEIDIILTAVAGALFNAVIAWVFYLAIEPYLRRRWPSTLIGWSRLLGGRASDAMVGRDLLCGVIGGAIAAGATGFVLLRMDEPINASSFVLTEIRQMFGLLANIEGPALVALGIGVFLLLGHLVLRVRLLAVLVPIIGLTIFIGSPGLNPTYEIAFRLAIAVTVVTVFVRFGVLAATVMWYSYWVIFEAALSLDPSSWLFSRSLVAILVLISIAAYGFYRSLGTQQVFAGAVLDD
jgi:hypothetical protein